MENKQQICNLLLPALMATRDQADLIDLEYEKKNGEETVYAVYQNGYKRAVSVTHDSGIAMIKDIMKALQ